MQPTATRLPKVAGDLSFGVYLLHFPVFMLISFVGLGGWTAFVIGLATTILVAIAVYALLEKPMIRLGRTISDRLTARGDAPAPPIARA